MNTLLLLFLFAFLPYIFFLLITRSFIKAAFFSSIFYFIIIFFISVIILTDARSLAKIESAETLFIYAPLEDFEKGVILNFSSTKTDSVSKDKLTQIQKNLKLTPAKVTNLYTRTFIFSERTLILLLDDEVYISEDFSLTKEEIINGINSQVKEESDSFFLIAISNLFQNIADPDNLETVILLYKQKELKTYPSIKALVFLGFLPHEILNPIISKVPRLT
jgi:hypothetical protein